MPLELNFAYKLNPSLSENDWVYSCATQFVGIHETKAGVIKTVGQITNITYDPTTNISTITFDSELSIPIVGEFILFSKNQAVELSDLNGYYAKVKLVNDSSVSGELFMIGSEVGESSK
jgi:hypothetical protein